MTDLTTNMNQPMVATTGKEMWDFATAMAKANIIPKHFQNQPANIFVALDMSQRLGVGVMEIMQNTYVVQGKPGFSASWSIGMANKSGVFKGPIHFEEKGTGDGLAVTAYAIVRETGERVEFTASMAMAKAEGWTKNPKYKTMGAYMLRLRAATLLIRTTCPEVLLGMQTTEEVQDVQAARSAEYTTKVESLAQPAEESASSPSPQESSPEALADAFFGEVETTTPGGDK